LKLLTPLLLALAAAYAIACALTIYVNPEVSFWHEAVTRREKDITSIRNQHPGEPIIIFTGGSSCAFSIDPTIIEKTTGRPTMNLGLPVAAGARYIIHQALRQARPGDLVIYTTAADILTYTDQEPQISKIAFALEAKRGLPTEAAGGSTFGKSLSVPDYFTLPRPGADYLIVIAGRLFNGKGYRYKFSDIRYHGLIQTPVRDMTLQPSEPRSVTRLHPEGREILARFTAAAKTKGVQFAYSLPLTYTATAQLKQTRAKNAEFLAEVAKIMPVIDDGYTGAIDNLENFSDGIRHLSEKGSKVRSEAIAKSLEHDFRRR
jgi:hypothetical protein